MIKIKCGGIYKIEHNEYYYIGKSRDIFSRFQSHYTSLYLKKSSSPKFQELFNNINISEWEFKILEYVSFTEFKSQTQSKGTKLIKEYDKYLFSREKYWMNQYSINFCLNKNVGHFK